jgi:hypothetical protein
MQPLTELNSQTGQTPSAELVAIAMLPLHLSSWPRRYLFAIHLDFRDVEAPPYFTGLDNFAGCVTGLNPAIKAGLQRMLEYLKVIRAVFFDSILDFDWDICQHHNTSVGRRSTPISMLHDLSEPEAPKGAME